MDGSGNIAQSPRNDQDIMVENSCVTNDGMFIDNSTDMSTKLKGVEIDEEPQSQGYRYVSGADLRLGAPAPPPPLSAENLYCKKVIFVVSKHTKRLL